MTGEWASAGRRARGLVGLALVTALGASGCGEDEQTPSTPGSAQPVIEDPGPVHVHGLGTDPRDSALFIATHTGLFRAPRGQRKAERVAGRYQDTMAFTVVGPNRFLGSGHPDGRERLPPFLGLIESKDAGKSWQPVSLQGRVDFHLLEVAGARVYGFGSDFESRRTRFMVSEDRGRSWSNRTVPEPLISLSVDPRNGARLIGSGARGLYLSSDAGRSWRSLDGAPGLLTWTADGRLYLADEQGTVNVSADRGKRWQAVGQLGGAPAAFERGPRRSLLAALHDGTVKESSNGGGTWRVRSAP